MRRRTGFLAVRRVPVDRGSVARPRPGGPRLARQCRTGAPSAAMLRGAASGAGRPGSPRRRGRYGRGRGRHLGNRSGAWACRPSLGLPCTRGSSRCRRRRCRRHRRRHWPVPWMAVRAPSSGRSRRQRWLRRRLGLAAPSRWGGKVWRLLCHRRSSRRPRLRLERSRARLPAAAVPRRGLRTRRALLRRLARRSAGSPKTLGRQPPQRRLARKRGRRLRGRPPRACLLFPLEE